MQTVRIEQAVRGRSLCGKLAHATDVGTDRILRSMNWPCCGFCSQRANNDVLQKFNKSCYTLRVARVKKPTDPREDPPVVCVIPIATIVANRELLGLFLFDFLKRLCE